MPGRHGVVLALAAATYHCGLELEATEPPHLTEVVVDYNLPTGSVMSLTSDEFTSAVTDGFGVVSRTSTLGFAGDVVGSFGGSVDDLDLDDLSGTDLGEFIELDRDRLVATLDMTYVCQGFEEDAQPPVSALRDGRLLIEGAADDRGLFPLFWGRAEACRYRWFGQRLEINGIVGLYVDAGRSRIRLRDVNRAPVIVAIIGDIASPTSGPVVEDAFIDMRLSRVSGRDRVETRVISSQGNYVIGFDSQDLGPLLPPLLNFTLRAADGIWICSFLEDGSRGACENPDTLEEREWP